MKTRIFYQDFLYKNMNDADIDEKDSPKFVLEYRKLPAIYEIYSGTFELSNSVENLLVVLKYLMTLTKERDWQKILNLCDNISSIYIVDDIPLVNDELKEYKYFFLKTYVGVMKSKFENCYIVCS